MKLIWFILSQVSGEMLLIGWLIIMSIVLALGFFEVFVYMFYALVVGVVLFVFNKFV